MSEQFKVGDICIGQNFVRCAYRNGQECQITEPLANRQHWIVAPENLLSGDCYIVVWSDGSEHAAYPHQLRKKHPPRSAKAIMRAAILKAKQPVEVPA